MPFKTHQAPINHGDKERRRRSSPRSHEGTKKTENQNRKSKTEIEAFQFCDLLPSFLL